ncbi:uncharacterized protein LOC129567161 [Sitodiplosis mosellana]|uniref:uncharacterized protein LOC129567161 n=1 Tax=Sitodiplosis mosellana TaxID=263140 RepID=UPI002443F614|nr:uncharacterized protein LOC129567161 [Sitodiplosis mosellana]XP_055299793.1 uncharacterized protein LOC129567161 [Sitodiplosis mosellana]
MPRRYFDSILSDVQCSSDEPINVQHSLHAVLPSKYHILYVSIKALRSRLDDLELYVHRLHQRGTEIHVIAITEINIHAETSKYVNLPEYNAYFSTNPNSEGGVAILLHKSLTSGIIENAENGGINCLIAHIPKLNVNIGVLYQDPTATTELLVEYYKRILRKTRMILFSNVDIDLLTSNVSIRRYTDTVREHNFFILNKIDHDSATRNSSIMDHILTNVTRYKYSLSIHDVSSDTKVILLGFDDRKPHKVEFIAEPSVVPYEMVDFEEFNQRFSEIDLQRIGCIDSLVLNMIGCKRDSTVQMERFRQNRDKPWIYENSLNKSDRFKMRGEAYAKQINGTFELHGSSRRLRDTVNEFLTNKSSSKHFIDAIRIKTNRGHWRLVVDKKEIANILNEYFLNIGKNLHSRIPCMTNYSIPEVDLNENYIDIISTTTAEVETKIRTMKPNNNINDSISSNNLKFHSRTLAPFLTELFNDCFRNGVYPRSLKIDRIVPAFKSLDPLKPKNYRPITVPYSLSKLMESIICDRITEFCHQNDIIDKNQYGFQKNSSAMSAVVSVVDYLQAGLSRCPGSIGACLFIDLKKASNSIPHVKLMEKLFRIGIRGSLYALIKSYLRERRQYVDIDNVSSEIAVNTNAYSIPQGSVLGPFFLLLYINDICKLKLHGKIILCADDTAIVYIEADPVTLKRHMESDFELLIEWYNRNGFTLNTKKTKVMLFNGENIDLQINLMIRDKAIEFVDNYKYMGVYLQNNLEWDVHINKIITEISAVSVAIKKIGSSINEKLSFIMYQELVYWRLAFMASVYGTFSTKVQLNRLQAAQDMAIRSIFSGANEHNINDTYVKQKLLKVSQIINYDLALFIYKIKNNFLKLNRTLNYVNCENVLGVGAKYFESLDSSIQDQQKLGRFKRSFKRSFINSNRGSCSAEHSKANVSYKPKAKAKPRVLLFLLVGIIMVLLFIGIIFFI